MSALNVELHDDDGRLVVSGDVDASTAAQLRRAFEQAAADVQVDLAGCTFMDSSGISVLTEAQMRHTPQMRIVDVSRPVRLVLEVSGLAEVFLADLPTDSPGEGAEADPSSAR